MFLLIFRNEIRNVTKILQHSIIDGRTWDSIAGARRSGEESGETRGNYKKWGSEASTYTCTFPPLGRIELMISSIARPGKFRFCLEGPFSRIASHILLLSIFVCLIIILFKIISNKISYRYK